MANGYVMWEGKSRFDNKDLVMVGTGFETSSANRKTGNMIQTWIFKPDMNPVEVLRNNLDVTCCGDCKLRGDGTGHKRVCYVNVWWTVNSVYKAYKKGLYPKWDDDAQYVLEGTPLRMGSYGDPAMIPYAEVQGYVEKARNYTCYTHQWNKPWASDWKGRSMASVDNEQEFEEATKQGWKTFRIIQDLSEKRDDEVVCANVQNKLAHCNRCCLCTGNNANVVVLVHGSGSSEFKNLNKQ